MPPDPSPVVEEPSAPVLAVLTVLAPPDPVLLATVPLLLVVAVAVVVPAPVVGPAAVVTAPVALVPVPVAPVFVLVFPVRSELALSQPEVKQSSPKRGTYRGLSISVS